MSVKASHTLKRLQSDKEHLKGELAGIREEVNTLNKKASSVSISIKGIDTKIKNLSKKDIVVSEHAMLRYIERVYGLDLNELKEEILGEGRKAMIEFAGGNGKFTINGTQLIAKNGVITTIV